MWKEYIVSLVDKSSYHQLSFFAPAETKDLAKVEKELDLTIPQSLADLLCETNGVIKTGKPLVWSTEEIVENTLEARGRENWKHTPVPVEKHLFFANGLNADLFAFDCTHTDEEMKIFVWEATQPFGLFICVSLEEWLKIWLSVDMSRYYRGPQRLQEYVKLPGNDIESLLPRKLTIQQKEYCWQRQVVCPCGEKSRLKLYYYGELLDDGGIADIDEYRQKEEVKCSQCGEQFVLFEPYEQGYDSVVCGFLGSPEGDYCLRKTNKTYQCECGCDLFSLVVTASYDSDFYEFITLETQKELDESYGWYDVQAICSNCHKVVFVIDYECA